MTSWSGPWLASGGTSWKMGTPSRDQPWRVATRRSSDLAFGERDVEDLFAPLHALEEELECQCGLAGSRGAFDEIKPVGIEAAAQNVVQARHAGRDSSIHSAVLRCHASHAPIGPPLTKFRPHIIASFS